LKKIQRLFFRIGAEIAGVSKLENDAYEELTRLIDEFERVVSKPKRFVILEKDESTAFLSVARATVRRAEREVARLYFEGRVSELAVEWLNKLSYLLYLAILFEGGVPRRYEVLLKQMLGLSF